MPNLIKSDFLCELKKRFGNLKKLPNSLSLFEIGDGLCRIYIRYSKIHSRNQAFYGIRKEDLKYLEGYNSVICFLWEKQAQPIFIPYAEFEDIFSSLEPASDGQIKASIFLQDDGMELYIANSGRFNIESYFGWDYLSERIDLNKIDSTPDFNHSQIQTLIGSIGLHKGLDIWIPPIDRNKLDWNYSRKFECIRDLPNRYDKIMDIISEVDIIWLQRGSSQVKALFEVEHSTPIYSGLLRFNDLHLIEPFLNPKYSIVSNDIRRALFFKQINRPTFKISGLVNSCNFLDYKDVFSWYTRLSKEPL
ncbi:MAG: hypothetical protein V1720_01880 [bacterium]